jgi:hypothetical protein
MKRSCFAVSLLALMLAAGAGHAQVPKTVKLAGQVYDVTAVKRSGQFKNGVTVNLQNGNGVVADADVPKKANLAFVPGATPAEDRLFVVASHQADENVTADGLYILQGTDANGNFSPEASNATVLLRGNLQVNGRLQNITFLNDTDTGAKKDRNLFVYTLTNTDFMRFLDLGDLVAGAPHTEANAFRNATVFQIIRPGDTEQTVPPDPDNSQITDDPNAPTNGQYAAALAPNGMLIVAGSDTGPVLSVIDPVNGTKFFPVKTSVSTVTTDKVEDTGEARPQAFVHLQGDEYLMMVTDPDTGANATESDLNNQSLYHLRITLPADLTKEAPDSIKVEFISRDDLPSLGLGQSPTHKLSGLAVGRELAPGKPILYMADWAGNLFTLRPQ